MKRFITLLWIAVTVFMLSGCSNTKQEMELTYRDQGIKHMNAGDYKPLTYSTKKKAYDAQLCMDALEANLCKYLK